VYPGRRLGCAARASRFSSEWSDSDSGTSEPGSQPGRVFTRAQLLEARLGHEHCSVHQKFGRALAQLDAFEEWSLEVIPTRTIRRVEMQYRNALGFGEVEDSLTEPIANLLEQGW
jgi:hypothetical protein